MRPLSWRVELLPFLEGELYSRWDQSQTWDSPANAELARMHMDYYASDIDSLATNVVVVTGPETCWPDDKPVSLENIPDGASRTILLIQYPYQHIAWAQPKDLTLEEALDLYSQPSLPLDYGSHRFLGLGGDARVVNVIFADGSGKSLPLGLPRETLRALFTANGGEDVDVP